VGILVYALHDDEGNFNKNSLGALSELQDRGEEERQVVTVAWDYANTVGVDAPLWLLLGPRWVLNGVGVCGPFSRRRFRGPVPLCAAPFWAAAATDASSDSLFSRNGLIRYILSCCQDTTKRGGLRDKPSKYV
jgi:hypothetical protein